MNSVCWFSFLSTCREARLILSDCQWSSCLVLGVAHLSSAGALVLILCSIFSLLFRIVTFERLTSFFFNLSVFFFFLLILSRSFYFIPFKSV